MDIENVLAANRSALDEMVETAEKARVNWTTPRASGKWSASQVTEHVALSMEEAAKMISEQPTKLPTLPAIARPLARAFLFNRVLKKRAFPNVKTSDPLDPPSGPASPEEARDRLHVAFAGFADACRDRAAAGKDIASGAFGNVSVVDYATFMEVHTRHHTAQIPVSAA